MRTYLTLVLVIIIAIISLWRQEGSQEKADQEATTEARFPDYFMDNFSVTSMDASGKPSHILRATKLLHYDDDDSAELLQPFLSFTQPGNNFTLQASRAIFLKKENIIQLYDNVVIHRAASDNQSELFIYTDYLKVDTESRIAETEQKARVKTSDAELHTTGLLFDNMQGILRLKSQVKGVYERNH